MPWLQTQDLKAEFALLFLPYNIKIIASVSRITLSNKIIMPNVLDTPNKSSKVTHKSLGYYTQLLTLLHQMITNDLKQENNTFRLLTVNKAQTILPSSLGILSCPVTILDMLK